MIQRALRPLLAKRLGEFPAVALVGPRQVGKTTLARTLSKSYFDLEQDQDRLRLDLQWDEVCRAREVVVLDEAQAFPQVFARLRGAIDRDRGRRGRFLLLGSVSPALMRTVSQSLAGRLAVCELTPFTLSELAPGPGAEDRLWLRGGFPDGGALGPESFPAWQREFLNLMGQRDLPNWGLPARPQTTQRLFTMLAHCHGQAWDASRVAGGLGLTYHTVNSYLEHLGNAYLIRLLPPFQANIRKRLVRRPKLYWRDSGLLHALLGVSGFEDLLARPWVGSSWEGWVVEQILSHLIEAGVPHEAHFAGTSDGRELDLLLELRSERWAIDVKLTSEPGPGDIVRLSRTADLFKADRRVLVSRTAVQVKSGDTLSTSLSGLLPFLLRRR